MLEMPRAAPRPGFEFLAGIDNTRIHKHDRDISDLNQHWTLYPGDFRSMRDHHIRSVRVCIPWHTIERDAGVFDWSLTDRYLACLRDLGLDPIADPIHHTSFPRWLEGGFANPDFAARYCRFVRAFAERYPWIGRYTVFNEPFATTILCGLCGLWYPHHQGDRSFVAMLGNVCRALCEAGNLLTALVPQVQLVHVDTCERHAGLDAEGEKTAAFRNDLRFIVLDLMLGRVGEGHPLRPYLREHGMSEADLDWFRANRTDIHVLGLDYYTHSELAWTGQGRVAANPQAKGFAATALDYVERFQDYLVARDVPLMLAETNLDGGVYDRLSWLKHMVEEYGRLLGEVAPLGLRAGGFCWYAWLDTVGWCGSCCADVATLTADPHGIILLERSGAGFVRRTSVLSETYGRLAAGGMTAADIPAYRFHPSVLKARRVEDYLHLMAHWDWKDQPAPPPREILDLLAA